MKTTLKFSVVVAALVCALGATGAYAQTESGFYHPLRLNLAAAEAAPAGGGGEEDKDAELAKKLQNPVADLISVPFQNNWDFGIGPAHAMEYTLKFQPVIPVSISSNYNVIIRTIVPVIHLDAVDNNPLAPAVARESHSGLGDTTQSFFLSPKKPVCGWVIGAGPVLYYPTATDSVLGAGKWGAGPTIVVLRQQHGWTYGILANHIWSYAGWGDTAVNSTFLQPFLTYTTKKKTTYGVNTESTYNWENSEWTVPLNFSVQQLVKICKLPVAFQFGYRYYADKPSGGPDWGLRFDVTFLFPKK